MMNLIPPACVPNEWVPNEWVPISVYGQSQPFGVDWCYMGAERFSEPFFVETIQRRLTSPFNQLFRPQTTLNDLIERQAVQPGLAPTGFIFSHVALRINAAEPAVGRTARDRGDFRSAVRGWTVAHRLERPNGERGSSGDVAARLDRRAGAAAYGP